MQEIKYGRVVEIWQGASKAQNTLGILEAFNDVVTVWQEGEIAADDVAELHFIGGMAGDRYTDLTQGRYKLKELSSDSDYDPSFQWNPDWRLICVRDPKHRARVIIDGNGRAFQLHLGVRKTSINVDSKIGIIVGDLVQGFVFLAKAVTPLWR